MRGRVQEWARRRAQREVGEEGVMAPRPTEWGAYRRAVREAVNRLLVGRNRDDFEQTRADIALVREFVLTAERGLARREELY